MLLPYSFFCQNAKPTKSSLMIGELKATLDAMATSQSPEPDGVLTEFHSRFWDTLGTNFTHMIHQAIQDWRLLLGMTSGLIVLIPKDGDREYL